MSQQQAPTVTAIGAMSVDGFLHQLAARTPSPGGGAAAAVAGAVGAAQLKMVAEYATSDDIDDARESLARAASVLVALADEDAQAYARYTRARRERDADPQAYASAARAIADVPLRMAEAASQALAGVDLIRRRAPEWFSTDIDIGAGCLRVCLGGARRLIEANLPELDDSARTDAVARLARAGEAGA